MGKRIALFAVLFLGLVLVVTLVARKWEETVQRAEPAKPAVKEKIKREAAREPARRAVKDKVEREAAREPGEEVVEKGLEKAVPEVAVQEKERELARLKALRDEYDLKYRVAMGARSRYELEKLRREDPQAYRELMEKRHLEQMERLRVEDPEKYEEYELKRLLREDPQAYREAMEGRQPREMERLGVEGPEVETLADLRDEYDKMYRELAEELGVEPELIDLGSLTY